MSDTKRDYEVEIEVVTTHRFHIEAVHNGDEAIALAEQLLVDGEQGSIVNQEHISEDAWPLNEEDI